MAGSSGLVEVTGTFDGVPGPGTYQGPTVC